ncbi:MAG: hypothetical protein NT029_10590 [Armatimonadetes bacterium]|nr:hypothetical protein [Armatimonadota bacterium]
MTCIVGFIDNRGDILLGADARVSWWLPDSTCEGVQDEMFKLYAYSPHLAVAFAGNMEPVINWLIAIRPQLLRCLRGGVLTADRAKRSNYRIERAFRRNRLLKDTTADFLVGAAWPAFSKCNILLRVSYRGLQTTVNRVPRGDYAVCGSCEEEPQFREFRTKVLDPAFKNRATGVRMGHRIGWLHSGYGAFTSTLNVPWKTVGEILHTVVTAKGAFRYAEAISATIRPGEEVITVVSTYDCQTGTVIQANMASRQVLALIRPDQWNRYRRWKPKVKFSTNLGADKDMSGRAVDAARKQREQRRDPERE